MATWQIIPRPRHRFTFVLPFTGSATRHHMVYCGAKDGWERWEGEVLGRGVVNWFIPWEWYNDADLPSP
jgi:hypothetical protein